MSRLIRTYTELMQIQDYLGRYRYLKLHTKIGDTTFGWERYLNQRFYTSNEWRQFRRDIIVRDGGCDLGVPGHEYGPGDLVVIHHLNPINTDDIIDQTEYLMNPEYVVSCKSTTHNAIHYGDESLIIPYEMVVRHPNDTCPWKT